MNEIFRKTKIICTLGPVSNSFEMIEKLARTGMDVARLNFSYGTYPEYSKIIRDIRRVEKKLKRPIAILQDLQGPRIRLGFFSAPLQVKKGEKIIFGSSSLGRGMIPIDYPFLNQDVDIGHRILIGDQGIAFYVEKKKSDTLVAKALSSGVIRPHQGIHFPDSRLHIPSPTPKDFRDFQFGLSENIDFVALSFVRSSKDLEKLRRKMRGKDHFPHLISKIEQPEAIQNLDDILMASDGVLVARGDLGLEMGLEEIPFLQKKIIQRAAHFGKYVITATQMLESMIEKENPTRAEVSDVANAVIDGTDAVLLSGETASGNFPLQSVQVMSKILKEVETGFESHPVGIGEGDVQKKSAFALSEAARNIAEKMKMDRIVSFTYSGSSALRISKFRPKALIVGVTVNQAVWRKMALFWGVYPLLTRMVKNTDQLIQTAERELKSHQLMGQSKSIVIITGIPLKKSGITNLLKVQEI